MRKCGNRRCCKKERSNISQILGNSKFIPGPVKICKTTEGLKLADPEDSTAEWTTLPWRMILDAMVELQSPLNPTAFDFCCLTTRGTLANRYCQLCAIYFATQATLKRHKLAKICMIEKWPERWLWLGRGGSYGWGRGGGRRSFHHWTWSGSGASRLCTEKLIWSVLTSVRRRINYFIIYLLCIN